MFWSLFLINVLPIVLVTHFYTGDGPAHLYNAQLIRMLILEPEGPWSSFFELRQSLIPNLGGHALLVALLSVCTPLWAEKIAYLLIILLTATGFRYAFHLRRGLTAAMGIMALPLLQHFCLYIGFQSFSLSLALMLWCVGYQRRMRPQSSLVEGGVLAGLLFACALCHPVPALVFVGYFGMAWLGEGAALRSDGWLRLLPLLPASALVLAFVGVEGHAGQWQFPSLAGQWASLLELQPLIAHNLVNQAWAARIYLVVLILASMACFIWRKPGTPASRALGITALLLLFAYFITPASWATGGFIHVRLLLCALFMWVVWLGASLPSKSATWRWMLLPVAIANVLLMRYNLQEARYHDARASALMEAVEHLPAGVVLVPLNYSQHWLHYNIGLYPSALKPGINLDNYEAYEPHFPVKWKAGMAPSGRLGPFGGSRNPAFSLQPYEAETGAQVEAVLACFDAEFAEADSTTLATRALLEQHFDQRAAGEAFTLWIRK